MLHRKGLQFLYTNADQFVGNTYEHLGNDMEKGYARNAKHAHLQSKEGLNFLYTNADQFVNKRDQLLMMIAHDEPDLILITEVLPKNQINPITSASLHIEGYTPCFNFNPEDGNLGAVGYRGVAIYSKYYLKAIEVEIDGFPDHAWVELPTKDGPPLVGCVYRSPSDDRNMEQSMKSSKKVANVIKSA